MSVLPICRHNPIALIQHRDDSDCDRLLAIIEVHEPADFLLRVEFSTFVLETTDSDHLLQQIQHVLAGQPRLFTWCGHRSSLSSVEISPSGKPSSRALSNRRMILPLRVFGKFCRNAISFGDTAGPRRCRACPSSSLRSLSLGSKAPLSATKALTTSPTVGSGIPITPTSATAGCSISALSTSNGPI